VAAVVVAELGTDMWVFRSAQQHVPRGAWQRMNEADTCRKLVVPKLQAAGWEIEPHSIAEQRTITDGRIVPAGKGFIRRPPKRVDYLLRYTRDFPLAVIEAKASYRLAAEGLQQWTVPAAELLAGNCNLDRKNPRAKEDIAHLPPEQIAASILEKEQRIAEIMGHIQKLLAGGGGS
jgi:hypothetical protein